MIPRFDSKTKLLNIIAATVVAAVLAIPQVIYAVEMTFPVGLSPDKVTIQTADGISKINVEGKHYHQLMDEGYHSKSYCRLSGG